ncbi:MAG: chromosomal replication initiator protein DnaA [Hyphomicrobiales bacterium]|nr:chromosomal replication initiator protein DnaA [Hyphomicrobiales bacterium]
MVPQPNNVGYEESWMRICRKLRSELGDDVFNSWFARIELVGIEGQTVQVSVPTKFLKSWLQSHYNEKLLANFCAEWPHVSQVVIGLRSGVRAPAPREAAANLFTHPSSQRSTPNPAKPSGHEVHASDASPASPAKDGMFLDKSEDHRESRSRASDSENLSGSPLDRRLNFTTFLVGRSNQLAYAAAQQVAQAQSGGAPLYNPLYIHACVGLGKTHVLQAIAHAAGDVGQRVIYLTAEKFMHGFVAALKAQSSIAFKERLRAIDVLIIDDVQFLQGKAIQLEFCHTINALIDAGKQVVVAADRPPGDLESLEERVRSRLAGGLCVEMGALDEALRVKILSTRIAAARVHQPGFEVPDLVVSYIARTIQTNGRDLDGAVNRLLAHSTLNHSPLCIETAEAAIRDLVRTREPKRVKIEDIQKLVASHFNVSRADILSSRRTAQVVKPRQIAMYLAKMLTLRSLPEIGRRFGGRDHTTVLHAVRKIENLSGSDHQLNEELELLKRMLIE